MSLDPCNHKRLQCIKESNICFSGILTLSYPYSPNCLYPLFFHSFLQCNDFKITRVISTYISPLQNSSLVFCSSLSHSFVMPFIYMHIFPHTISKHTFPSISQFQLIPPFSIPLYWTSPFHAPISPICFIIPLHQLLP